jgi:hypothetical protein
MNEGLKSNPRPDHEVIRIANLLMDVWYEAEKDRVTSSYVATFVDMARAVIADREKND